MLNDKLLVTRTMGKAARPSSSSPQHSFFSPLPKTLNRGESIKCPREDHSFNIQDETGYLG